MQGKKINRNKEFLGRDYELEYLEEISQRKQSSILVVFGRRRVGKTELLEQFFYNRNILKFEGIEGSPQSKQIANALEQLSIYTQDPNHAKLKFKTWTEFFRLLSSLCQKGKWTIYFEEIQWLASYKTNFIAELKYLWDNEFRHNKELILILCGSSPSFIVNKILHSKALYNRSQYQLCVEPFNLLETKLFLKNKSNSEVMDAYLSIGGIPEYLKLIKGSSSSVFLSLCKNSFRQNGFFVNEFERIFTSSLAGSKYYQKIIEYLAKKRFASREDIAQHLNISPGGTISNILEDLAICNFIEKYTPYNLKENSTLVRYTISDEYLQFFYAFIKPKLKRINSGDFNHNPSQALKTSDYAKWLGYSFERLCRKKHNLIAKILGFNMINYRYGAYFSKGSINLDPGYQIDLVFDRDDKVLTVCEIKYSANPIDTSIIQSFEKKLQFLPKDKKSIHKVLISANGISPSLEHQAYFDQIITLDTLFDPKYY